jgi:hypothetical protein
MSIQVQWLDDTQRIIVLTMVGRWQWDEMFDAIEACHQMMDTVDYPVRTLFDFTRNVTWPLNPLANMRRANKLQHPRSSTVAIVGISRFFQAIVDLFQRFGNFSNPNGVHFFATMPEAVDYLNEQVRADTVGTSNGMSVI